MSLENYWKVLANSAYKKARWAFYNNGWFSAKTQNKLLVFNDEGSLFLTLPQETNVHNMADGWIAIGSMANGSWKFYDKHRKLVAETTANTTPLSYGRYSTKLPTGETHIVSLTTLANHINLGYGVACIADGPNGMFAYSQVVRNQTIWHLCQEKNGELVRNDLLLDIAKVEFLADGSYVLYCKNHSARVFNRFGHKVFSCNYQKTKFRIVGNHQVLAYNGKAHRGVYSTEDGDFLLSESDVELYWDNGAYFSPSMGFAFFGYNGLLSSRLIYKCCRLANEFAVVWFRGRIFVIDPTQPMADLRRQLCNILAITLKDDQDYTDYLVEFLLMLV